VDTQSKQTVIKEKSKLIAINNALQFYLVGISVNEDVVNAKKWGAIQTAYKSVRETWFVAINAMNHALKIVLHANKNVRQSVLTVSVQKSVTKCAIYVLNLVI
jgi:hypothetical protein